MANCPNCGKEVGPEDQFCRSCGYSLRATAAATNVTPSQGPGILGTEKDVILQRIVAVIIDGVILSILLSLLLLGALFAGGIGGLIVGFIIIIMGWASYSFLLEGWRGKTVGKSLMGIVVVREDGSRCTYGASLVRNLLRFIDGLFFYVVGLIVMATSDRRQRLGDRLARTVVVKARK